MKKKRSVFLQYLLLVSIFLLPTLIYGQTNPDITLSNSLDNDTVCQSTSFTLTVSDTQSDLTTYTLSYGTTQVVSSSTSGLISFTVTGLTSETVLTVVASNATGTDTSSITIYVPLLLSSGVISTTASSTLCYGGYINADIIGDGSSLSTSSATIDPGSSSASITYQWQFKTTSDDWANFTGASTSTNLTSSVLSGFPVFESTTIRRVAYATKDDVTCSVNITYTELSFTVSSVIDPIITSNTTDYNVCSDQSYNFTTSTISGITHRWYLGTTLVHTGDSYTLDAGTISTDSTLGLIASSASCSSTLVTATLKVAPLPIITISSGLVSDTFCARDEFTITVNDTQSSNSTYKLSYAGGSETKTSSTGAVTFTLKLASQGDISVTATSLTGCTDTVTKTIFIPKLLSPGTVTSTQGVLCYGETISANISSTSVATTTSDSSAASITYAWYYSTDNLVTWTSIGSNTTSLATNTLANLGGLVTDISFKREASVSRGGSVSCSPLSTYISFSVSSELVTPVINSPSTVCIASDNTFTVVDAGYDYTWSVATLSATGLNFVLNAGDLPKGDYVLSVYGETASCSTTVVTQTLIVTEAPVLTINTGLLDNAVCSGESFTITVSDTQIGSLTTYTLSAPGGPYVKSSSTGQVTFTLSVTSETDLSVTSVPTDGCGATVTQTISVPKIGTPGTVTSTQGVLCYGESLSANITNLTAATLDGDSSSASITYAWYFSTDSQITWNNIAGATSSTLATTTLSNSVGGVISNTTVRRDAYVIADGEDCSPLSTYISFSVSSELVTPVINSPSTVCIASDNTFTVVDAGYDYTWSVATLSATGLNFVLNAGDLPKGDYVLSVYGETASCSTTVVTQTLIVTEAPVLTINTGLLDNAVCSGESFTITVSDTQIGSLTTYTLSAPGGPYVKSSSTGQVTFTLSVTSETDLSVTSVPTDGCGATVTQTISVPKIGTPGTVTSTQGVLCYGESLSANITNLTAATLDGDSSSASITYAWYFSTDSQITWNNIAGATSSTLATTTLSNSVGGVISNTTVRRDAYVIADGEDCSPLSTYISFSVSSELVTPVINSPSTVCIASDNTFTVVDAGYDYTWSVATLSATGLNFVLNAGDLPKGDYVLSVYGETASCSTTVVTQTLIVTEAPVLTINTGLLDNAVCSGESFTITVSDTQIGSLTTYTLSAPGGPYVKSSSTGQVTFTLSVTSETDLSVTSVPTDGCGATVTQTISVPKIGTPGTVTSTQGVLCYGESLSANITNLTAATLDGDSSSASITYAWYFSTDSQITWNNIAGATSSTLATTTLSNSVGGVISNTTVRRDAYVIADGEDCSPLSTYISFSVSSELVTPVINSPSTVCIASDNTFTVVDAGYDYTWSVATLSATGLNFVLNAGDLPKGDYVLSVYGETASCSTTVVTQTLIVTEAPVLTINTGLLDNAVCSGESFTITVSDTQIGSLTTYTLSAPGGPYVKSSSTGQVTFTLSVTSETDLSVTSVPTDGCGATVTQTISVPKIGTPGTVTSTQGVLCYGESLSANITNLTAATLDGDSSSASITYQWYFSLASTPSSWVSITGAVSSSLSTDTLSKIAITEDISIQRVAFASIGTTVCEISNSDENPKINITVENVDGGIISPNILYSCDISGASYTVTVTEISSGNINYQWQSATSNVSASFGDISGETNASLIVSTNVTQTTYYRRITSTITTASTCTPDYSNVFELILNSVDPGEITDVGGIYCEGSVPPVLGQSSVVTSTYPIIYQWYKAETNSLITPLTWQTIASANNSTYITPALSSTFRYVIYRRGVIEDRGAASACENYSNQVNFEIFDTIDIGYVEPATGKPDFPYCVGDQFPNLTLISADSNIIDNVNYPGLVATWEMSNDGINWTPVTDIDNNEFTFRQLYQSSNNPTDTYYLSDDMYFRVKLVNTDTSLTTLTLTSSSVLLIPVAAETENLELGEIYEIVIGSSSVSVTVSAVNSTTDLIGAALATKIDSDVSNYTATYYSDSNIISIEDTASQGLGISTLITYGDSQSLRLNVLAAFNNTQNCTSYTAAYRIEVEDRPTLTVDGGSTSQFVCNGTAIDTIPISWSDEAYGVTITGLDSGLTINRGSGTIAVVDADTSYISGTDSITITGTPNSNHTFNVLLDSNCETNSDLNIQYTITTSGTPPVISALFMDGVDIVERTIWYNGTNGYHNTVCVDSSVEPSNTSSLTVTSIGACFNEESTNYGGSLQWQFIDMNSVSSVSPTLGNTNLTDGNGYVKGTAITWNPSFVASVTTGAWVTVRVRSTSTCSATVFSNWYSQNIWIVKSDQISQTNDVPELPILNTPAPNSQVFCNYWTGAIPTCELNVNETAYTQFFTSAVTGTNNYGSLEWELTNTNAGSINSNGVVTWNQGWSGNTQVRVRPSSCADPTSTDDNDWVESDVITILQVVETMPTVVINDIPTCPIPESGSYSTTLESDIPVDWYIKSSTGITSNTLIKTGTITFTTTQYNGTGYYQVEPNYNSVNLELSWSNTASGVIYLKAVPQGCSGTEPEWVRDIAINIPANPTMIPVTNNNGSVNPEICENETDFADISYNILGRSVTGIFVTDVNSATSIYAPLLDAQIVPLSQVTTITLSGTNQNDNLTRFVIITIEGTDYKVQPSSGESHDSVGEKLKDKINAVNNLSATYNNTTNELVITGAAGYNYTIYSSNTTSNISLALNYNVDDQIYSQVLIQGITGYIPPGTYQFEIGLTLDEGCVQEGNAYINLTVNADAELILTSDATTLNQDVCYNESIDSIEWNISGLDNLSNINLTGYLPPNISTLQTTSTFTVNSTGAATDYWNTRIFNFSIETDGDLCDEASQSGSITVYPADYLRPEASDPQISEILCEGTQITPIIYEYWGADSISASFQDLNLLSLTASLTTRTQIVSITFDDLSGTTTTDTTESYSIYINDEVYTINASATSAYTASNVLTLLSAAISSTVATSTIEGDYIVLTGLVSGTTFGIEGRSSNSSSFSFDEPTMERAPRVITITGTPTLTSTITTRQTYPLTVFTTTGNYCNGVAASVTETYTLFIDPLARLSVTSTNTSLEVCDGTSSDFIRFETTGDSNLIELSAVTSSGLYYPDFANGVIHRENSSSYDWYPDAQTSVTTLTVYTYTATATTNSCGVSDTLTVTGTITVYPHYINELAATGSVTQTVFYNQPIEDIQFDFSSDYSDVTIGWAGGDDLGLTLTSSGTILTLSGSPVPNTDITTDTTYPYQILVNSKTNFSPNCAQIVISGAIIVLPEVSLTLTSSNSTVDQEVYSGDGITPVTLDIDPAVFSYKIEWRDNLGNVIAAPPGITLIPFPDFATVSSLTLSGTLSNSSTLPIPYYYRISTVTSTIGIEMATFDGRILVLPEEEITTSVPDTTTICQITPINLEFDFVGIESLSFLSSPSLPSEISISTVYTTTPTFEITVVSNSTEIGEVFQVQIINEDGTSPVPYNFVTTTSNTTSTSIATSLASAITHPNITASVVSSTITLESTNPSFVFRVIENTANIANSFVSVFDSKIRIDETIPVTGSLIVSGTIITGLTTDTTYELTLETTGVRTSATTDSVTTELVIRPDGLITLTSSASTLNQEVCDGNLIDSTTFYLDGNATGYTVEWHTGTPTGLIFNPVSAILEAAATSTITLSGTLDTDVSVTTVYYYTITTTGGSCNSGAATISGTIVVYPKEEILLYPSAETSFQVTDYVSLEYTFEGLESLSLTASSVANLTTIGLTATTSFTSIPSVELTVVTSSTFAGEVYQIEIVDENGDVIKQFYQTTSATESITTIALGLVNNINQANIDVTASLTSSNVINIAANDPDYVFWIRINDSSTPDTIEHASEARMSITSTVPVQGVFSLTGTPTVEITEITSYTFDVFTPGIRCDTVSETTILILNPGAQVSLATSDTTLNQELLDNEDIEDVVFTLNGTADNYSVEWPTGIPSTLSFSPEEGSLGGTSTITLSGTLNTGATTTTVYYYTITPLDGVDEGSSISGSFVVYPLEIFSIVPSVAETFCSNDYINLTYEFEGYSSLSVSSSTSSTISTLGIFSSLTYSTSPSVELTVVASATSINEVFQIEIVEENGGSRVIVYQTSTATESINTIALGLAEAINNDSSVSASLTASNVINVVADSPSYVFWIRVNDGNTSGSMETFSTSRVRVTNAIPVTGVFSITGTPTVSITEITSYTLTINSPGIRSTATSATTIITLNPEQIISLTSSASSQNQEVCDNTAIEEVVFQLEGSASNYTGLIWIGNIPGGISQPTLSASNTLTLSGTISTGVTTKTVYAYSITTSGPSCESNTVTGTITVLPNHYIDFSAGSESDQTVCYQGDIDAIEFELSGGATGYTVTWSPSNPGLNIFESSSSSTTFTISGTINDDITTETVYTYTINTNGNACNVSTASVTGEITVIPRLVINVDTPLTQNQIGSSALCNDNDIKPIFFSFTSGNSPTTIVEWTDADGVSINSPGPTLNGNVLSGAINTASTELTTYFYTVIATDINGTCVFIDSFSGTLQVAPDIIVYEDYIQDNDVTDVTCTGETDGSIFIPITTQAEFELRIEGGQTATAQIDRVSLSVSDTLNAGDQISVVIDGITFTSVVASGTITQTILEELRDKVNFGLGSDSVAVIATVVDDGTDVYMQLIADTAGIGFSSSGTSINSTVTGTTEVATIVENKSLNYEYEWTGPNGYTNSSLSIYNLAAGTYNLAVSINDCEASTIYSFEIEEPSITVGTISETCAGDISVPITAYLTATQLSIDGPKVTVELFEKGADNSYSVPFGSSQEFTSSVSTNTFTASFYSLEEGETYQMVVTDNTCNSRITSIVGPITTFLTINEGSILTTDEECFGQGGTISLNTTAITGGSGYYSYNWTNLTSANQYITREVTGAEAGLYELTVTDQNYGCEETTTGIIEIVEVVSDITVTRSNATLTNDCYDSRDGTLEVVVTGGSGDFYYEWYFEPQTSSLTLLLDNDDPILVVDDEIPASYYAGGEYYVLVYDGGGVIDCPLGGTSDNFVITNPEEISFASASTTISNIICAGEETGSIYVEISGGSGNYLYTINGGIPYLDTTGVISENGLAAGNYTLIVEDADNECSTAQQITQDITISEPAGGALEISLNTITEIPCEGGLGSIQIDISGGSPLTTNSTSSVIDFYTVNVKGGNFFALNTSHDPDDSTLTIGNLSTPGTYVITVTDTNGCQQILSDIILNNSSNGLAATAVITQASGCNELSSTEGGSIQVTWPDRGDGNNAGYPLWQQRKSVNYDSFTIAINGTVAGADLTSSGINITTTNSITIYPSSTASTTFGNIQDLAAQLAYNINQISDLTATLNGSTILVKGEIIDNVTSFNINNPFNISVSGVSQLAQSQWSDLAGMAGMEIVNGLRCRILSCYHK